MALSLPDPQEADSFTTPTLKALFLVLIFFVGLTITTKDGRDRWIYGAFAVATIVALIHYRQIPWLYNGHWRF